MSNQSVVPFFFEGTEVRVVMINGDPWWVLADVCRVLGIANARDAASRLDDDEKGVAITDTPGGPQEMVIINESGLYSLILTSRKPEVRRFKKWVTGNVLPSIRKNGAYIDPSAANPAYILEQMAKMIEANNASMRLEWDRRAAADEERRLKHEAKITELLDSNDPSVGRRKKQKTMLEIVIDAGVHDKKDRAKLTRALSAGMTRWCRKRGVLTGETAERGTILYPVEVIDDWLKEEGMAKIRAHIARVTGQKVFDFDAEKTKRGK